MHHRDYPQDNRKKLTLTDYQALEDRARAKILKYTQDYANNTRSVFVPAVASTSGRIRQLLFRHAHREAEKTHRQAHPGHGVTAQPNVSDDYLKSKCPVFVNALKCKTRLILAKAAAMPINANI